MSASLTAANQLRTARILSIRIESPTVKTFTLKDRLCGTAKPGQYLMLWIPRVDEIPLSILDATSDGTTSVAVRRVGQATKALCDRELNATVGVRGPFGNSFTPKTGRILMVSGGTGTSPLLFLARQLAAKTEKLVFVTGAKAKDELLFIEETQRACTDDNVIATTEDGSYGIKGLATTPVETLLEKGRFDMIYTCGPEQMMRKVADLAEKHEIDLEASLERLMRCAIGLCGSCVIGKYRVCRDGPVFDLKQLQEMKREFGISRLDFDGRRIPL